MADALIVAEGLKVFREQRQVLDIPSFVVEKGEVLAVIGPNGSGKSTLLQALALLLPADMRYRFDDRAVRLPDEALALRRQMATVFQRPLLVEGSVFENVALGLRLRGISNADEVRRRVTESLAMFEVEHLAKRPARALSGGEAQRVSLARAWVAKPRMLFLDEPFMALDVLTRAAILADLRRVLREGGITTLFVTHDFAEIPPLADRVAVLMNGRIVQTGTAREVFTQPSDDQVRKLVRAAADLIGSLVAPFS